MAKPKHKKAAAKKVARPAAPVNPPPYPNYEVGTSVKYILNDEECAELEVEAGTTRTAEVMQCKETGEHLIRFDYRPGQQRTKGAWPGNFPGHITI